MIDTTKDKPAAIREDVAASADAREGIRQGLADAKKGKIRDAKEFFEEFEASMAYLG